MTIFPPYSTPMNSQLQLCIRITWGASKNPNPHLLPGRFHQSLEVGLGCQCVLSSLEIPLCIRVWGMLLYKHILGSCIKLGSLLGRRIEAFIKPSTRTYEYCVICAFGYCSAVQRSFTLLVRESFHGTFSCHPCGIGQVLVDIVTVSKNSERHIILHELTFFSWKTNLDVSS